MMKFFGKWEPTGIDIQDPGLKDYINLRPMHVPRMSGRNTSVRFWKTKYTVIERLVNKLMVPGHKAKKHFISSGRCGGKSLTAIMIVKKAFDIIEQRTKKNPVEIFVKAIENAAPREEITTIEYGGAKYPQAVDAAPQRRIDVALRFMVQGSYQKSYGKKTKAHEALAEEILKAYQSDGKSFAISKKLELERQADAAR
ncbi:MAG TPA: 30S ribosomal protein S7 [Candidatus Nanoarchaeia archaeon]|nr:30S ribosomal protein S7 [Candidatus Nanoarchaeia archaeon]